MTISGPHRESGGATNQVRSATDKKYPRFNNAIPRQDRWSKIRTSVPCFANMSDPITGARGSQTPLGPAESVLRFIFNITFSNMNLNDFLCPQGIICYCKSFWLYHRFEKSLVILRNWKLLGYGDLQQKLTRMGPGRSPGLQGHFPSSPNGKAVGNRMMMADISESQPSLTLQRCSPSGNCKLWKRDSFVNHRPRRTGWSCRLSDDPPSGGRLTTQRQCLL